MATFEKTGHVFFDTGGDEHPGIAELNQHRTFGMAGISTGKTDGAKLAGAALARALGRGC
ncbi:hypothetical protein AGMMS49543_10580 [Betaproteobacteria bacterium]|nr:hypothetical protein AGMMS49543_10580 [Betaproteobacteria bacterium]